MNPASNIEQLIDLYDKLIADKETERYKYSKLYDSFYYPDFELYHTHLNSLERLSEIEKHHKDALVLLEDAYDYHVRIEYLNQESDWYDSQD